MRIHGTITVCVLFLTCLTLFGSQALCQDHIKSLDAVRTSMTKVGNTLPDLIKKCRVEDLRTLERVFEINNYALVTIESYLKMIKVTFSSGGTINKEIVGILNGWLKLIAAYCEYDIKYFDEALAQTKDTSVLGMVNAEKKNITDLRDTSKKGVDENNELLKKLQ